MIPVDILDHENLELVITAAKDRIDDLMDVAEDLQGQEEQEIKVCSIVSFFFFPLLFVFPTPRYVFFFLFLSFIALIIFASSFSFFFLFSFLFLSFVKIAQESSSDLPDSVFKELGLDPEEFNLGPLSQGEFE